MSYLLIALCFPLLCLALLLGLAGYENRLLDSHTDSGADGLAPAPLVTSGQRSAPAPRAASRRRHPEAVIPAHVGVSVASGGDGTVGA